MFSCPVLSLTPDVTEALAWFHHTHEVAVSGPSLWWRRRELPRAGAIGAQQARQMAQLDCLLAAHQQELSETLAAQRKAAEGRGGGTRG